MSDKKKVLSCIQPTGNMHYGNYFGAVQNWVNLQEKYDCKYGIVDYHAMTMPYNPKKLRENTWELIFNLLAVLAILAKHFGGSHIAYLRQLSVILMKINYKVIKLIQLFPSCIRSRGSRTCYDRFNDQSTNKDGVSSHR